MRLPALQRISGSRCRRGLAARGQRRERLCGGAAAGARAGAAGAAGRGRPGALWGSICRRTSLRESVLASLLQVNGKKIRTLFCWLLACAFLKNHFPPSLPRLFLLSNLQFTCGVGLVMCGLCFGLGLGGTAGGC